MELFFIALSLILLGLLVFIGYCGFIILRSKLNTEERPWPYRAKKYFFSRSEQEFLRALNAAIDHSKYMVFPKVRLADFIEVTVAGREYQSWWNRIRSKHIDYLIWDIQQQKLVVAIELDGKSHNSEKMQARDGFVAKLYETVGLSLERVKVGENFQSRAQELSNSFKRDSIDE